MPQVDEGEREGLIFPAQTCEARVDKFQCYLFNSPGRNKTRTYS